MANETSEKGQDAAIKILAFTKQMIEIEHHHAGAIAGCLLGTGLGLLCDLGIPDDSITEMVAKILVGIRRKTGIGSTPAA